MPKIKPHSFAEKTAHRPADMSPLQRISDRFVVRIETAIEQVIGQAAKASAKPIGFKTYSQWAQALGPLSSLSVFRLLPLRGSIILHMEESMINSLVNLYFGGALCPGVKRLKNGFWETEWQLIERLVQSVVEQFCAHLSDLGLMKSAMLGHETSPSYVTGFKANEQVMCQPFRIVMDADNAWPVELVYSAEASDSLIELIQNGNAEIPAISDPQWQQQWSRALQQIHLPLRTILAQPTMRLPEVFAMKPGDIIPITPWAKPPLFVANHKFATGTLGEKNGCAAFKIDHMERRNAR
ncbi:MAG: FliM/FliN family flagellar motor switch protein [Parasphingorhabdus sp.]|uniref:FliM/FliN family flagellar motor switch protein n=1 Tax=Parasphingorhabdus sp. TaxID=2709688 RepID=UPI00300142D1